MNRHFLKTLKELQAELRGTESLSDDDRVLVERLHDEVDDLLTRSKKGHPLEHHSLRTQLEAAAKRFEVTHPNLTAVIGSVVDSLSAMGI